MKKLCLVTGLFVFVLLLLACNKTPSPLPTETQVSVEETAVPIGSTLEPISVTSVVTTIEVATPALDPSWRSEEDQQIDFLSELFDDPQRGITPPREDITVTPEFETYPNIETSSVDLAFEFNPVEPETPRSILVGLNEYSLIWVDCEPAVTAGRTTPNPLEVFVQEARNELVESLQNETSQETTVTFVGTDLAEAKTVLATRTAVCIDGENYFTTQALPNLDARRSLHDYLIGMESLVKDGDSVIGYLDGNVFTYYLAAYIDYTGYDIMFIYMFDESALNKTKPEYYLYGVQVVLLAD